MPTIILYDVKERLSSLGFSLVPSDDVLLQYNIDKVSTHIMNETNQPSVPHGAYYIAIDMIIGEFLTMKYAMGQLDLDTIDLSGAIKRVKDGDTDVEYAVSEKSSPAAIFQGLLNYLLHTDYDWGIWRRIRW